MQINDVSWLISRWKSVLLRAVTYCAEKILLLDFNWPRSQMSMPFVHSATEACVSEWWKFLGHIISAISIKQWGTNFHTVKGCDLVAVKLANPKSVSLRFIWLLNLWGRSIFTQFEFAQNGRYTLSVNISYFIGGFIIIIFNVIFLVNAGSLLSSKNIIAYNL
jgi:hypothetical protein